MSHIFEPERMDRFIFFKMPQRGIANWCDRQNIKVCTGVAIWYHSGLPTVPIRWVLIRDPNGKFKSQALLSTNPEYQPKQILEWFVRRWQMEVTFQETRKHLGMETQRQWSDLAISRTTPILAGFIFLNYYIGKS